MKVLIDTRILLWAAGEPDRLPAGGCELIENPDIDLMYSLASLWKSQSN